MKKLRNFLIVVMSTLIMFSLAGCVADDSKVSEKNDTITEQNPEQSTENNENETKNTDNTGDNSLQTIKDKGVLVLGTSADYAPYEFHVLNNGKDEIVGFDIQIAKAVAENLGVELKIIDMNFDGLLTALNSNQVDIVMAGMTPTPERMEAIDFSDIYYNAKQGVVIRSEDKDIYTSIDSLSNKKIAAQKSSLQEGIAKEQLPSSKLFSLTKIPNIVLELKGKNVEAAIMELPVAEGYVAQYPELMISNIEVKDETGGSAIAVKKGSSSLTAALNDVITNLKSDGSIDKFVIEANELVVVE